MGTYAPMRTARHGFSLVEVLVSIAVIGVILAILVPALASGRRAASRTACLSHLRDIGMALRQYMRYEGDGKLPLLHGYSDDRLPKGEFTKILPLLAAHLTVPTPERVDDHRYVPMEPFICPLDDEIGPEFGLSYDYFPGALMIDWTGSGKLDPTLVVPVTRRYELGEYSVLFTDSLKDWHDHPLDGRQAVFWDGHVGWLQDSPSP